MKKIGKRMCEVCKERISTAIIQNKYVCRKCYHQIKELQAINGYSKEFFKRSNLKQRFLSPKEIIKEVRKNHNVRSSQGLEVSQGVL